MVNPCCCSLQTGTRVVAILQIIASILGILALTATVIQAKDHSSKGKGLPGEFVGGMIFAFLMVLFGLFLGILLLIGANRRDLQKCKFWFYAMLIITCLTIASAVLSAFSGGSIGTPVISILLDLYFLWVVYAFMEEIRGGPPLGA